MGSTRQIPHAAAPFKSVDEAIAAGHEWMRSQGDLIGITAEPQVGGYYCRLRYTLPTGGGRQSRHRRQEHTVEIGKTAVPAIEPLTEEDALWLVWSNEHGSWWRANWRGYTTVIETAGRYPKRIADQICREANYGGHVHEVAVLAPEAFDLLRERMPEGAARVWSQTMATPIPAGDNRVRLGPNGQPPLHPVRVIVEENYQAGAMALALIALGASKP